MSFVRRLLGRKDKDAHEGDLLTPVDPVHSEPQPAAEVDAGTKGHTPSRDAERVDEDQVNEASAPGSGSDQAGLVQEAIANPEPSALPHPPGLRVGYATDVGNVRDHNEDTLVVFQGVHLGDGASDPLGFFVVTDGMGGHQAGEVASSLAARLVSHHVLVKIYLPFLLQQTPGADMVPLTEILRDAVRKANDQVHDKVPGGGTTLTCALILGQRAYIAHVGDSRAYLLTNTDMRQVTQDHSYVGRLMELGELTPEEAATHPQRHVLYRAIGQGDNLDIDTYHQPLPPGSRLLLCSDGLSGTVSEEAIGKIVAGAKTPQEACQNLIGAAQDAGGPDNITAILIEIPPD
jgi:serine/threonine protein phosphatase PrpC